MSASDLPFCVSAYMDKETYLRAGGSQDDYFATRLGAEAAFNRLVGGRRFFAVAWGYCGATGDWQDLGDWTSEDDND